MVFVALGTAWWSSSIDSACGLRLAWAQAGPGTSLMYESPGLHISVTLLQSELIRSELLVICPEPTSKVDSFSSPLVFVVYH
ncbi:uncharacterized protein F5147DRAFT_150488 [Suillus discolor]|uniref:Uncharacterized protein n=1 Tax=Suillus discolor TaxID=1912936 RepID=A0A9P7F901_9AGAM|nr:uncharacterized protein F5147DRAFT_150488 [Suillus discolor]KAG2109741.1 hypothetical protein F5147DRAFT_150488 [Suillus discolor]